MRRVERTLLVVLAIALLAVLAISALNDEDETGATDAIPGLSASQLFDAAADAPGATYWVGPRPGARYQLTETVEGQRSVRYLVGDVPQGDARASLLTVATYSASDPVRELREAARSQAGAKVGRTADGEVLLLDPSAPHSAYVAYPEARVQVEVYSPARGESRRLVSAGAVRRIPAGQPAG